MELKELLPFWGQLDTRQQQTLERAAQHRRVAKGTLLHNGEADCVGLFVVCGGVLRVFAQSEEGKEITLYRLYERDICLFSAACVLSSIQFDLQVTAETDTELFVIPSPVYKKLLEEALPVSRYTNELMASRFSDVMWLLDQILHRRFDARLAAALLEEADVQQTKNLQVTHEQLAAHLGSAREVVTRMLRYFQQEGTVSLSRGGIALTECEKLEQWAAESRR